MWSILLKNVIIGILCSLLIGRKVYMKQWCPPAEEYKPYRFSFELSSTPLEDEVIRISSHKKKLAHCLTKTRKCFPDINYGITSEFNVNDITIIISNISTVITRVENDTSLYVTFGNPLQSKKLICNPKLFYTSKFIECTHNIIKEGVDLTCSMKRVYPKVGCKYFVNLERELVALTNISESNLEMLGNPLYFDTKCTYLLPKSIITKGRNNVNITMYLKVKNDERIDVDFGQNISYSFVIDVPMVKLKDCPSSIEEGKNVTCACVANQDVSYRWYNETDEITGNNETHVLFIKEINRTTKNLYCISTNVLGLNSPPAFYKLNILHSQAIQSLTIKDEYEKDIDNNKSKRTLISCRVEGNPLPEISIFVGPRLVYTIWAPSSTFTLDFLYNITCASFTDVTCSVRQQNNVINRTAVYNIDCPPRLIFRHENDAESQVLNAKSNSYISIVLFIYCNPKPNAYSVIKDGFSSVEIVNVTDGKAFDFGFTVTYDYDLYFHTGTLNLTFKIKDENDFVNYKFIIHNGIKPPLTYSFSIINGEKKMSMTEIISTVVVSVLFILCLTGLIWWTKKHEHKKAGAQKHNIHIESLSIEDVEPVYEDIDSDSVEKADNDLIEGYEPVLPLTNQPDSKSLNLTPADELSDENDSVKIKHIEGQARRGHSNDLIGNEYVLHSQNDYEVARKVIALDNEYLTIVEDPSLDES